MTSANRISRRLSTTALTLAVIAALSPHVKAQEAPAVHVGNARITSLPDDWSHHHLVFSDPGTEEDAIKNGTHDAWLKIVNDPRYVIHQLKKGLPVRGPAAEEVENRYRVTGEDAEERAREHDRDWDRDGRGRHRHEAPEPSPSTSTSALHKDWSMSLGSTTPATVGAGQYPAKSNTSTSTANCSDFVVYNTGLAGSATQATIIAYSNLYSSCSGTVPTVLWQYNTAFAQNSNTADSSAITTSVAFTGIAGDPTPDIAFVQNSGAGVASLVLLKPTSNASLVQLNVAGTNNVTPALFSACTAPCMTRIPFANGLRDTLSSPFYDLANDVIYVGDTGAGADPNLHKFVHIFFNSATSFPIECGVYTTAPCSTGWPVNMGHGGTNSLTSPVVDSVSGNVFMGDGDGRFARVVGSTGVLTIQTTANENTLVDGPMVDSTPSTPVVYFFGTTTAPGNPGGVWQLPTNFTVANNGILETLGTTTSTVYDGDFDNIHYSGSGTTGNLYVCSGSTPGLYQVAINSTFTGAVTTIGTLASGAGACSPVTEYLNTGSSGAAVTTLSNATTTTLTVALASVASPATVASIAGISNGNYLLIDSEFMLVNGTPSGSTVPVTRAQLGTSQPGTHNIGATVTPYKITTPGTVALIASITAAATSLTVASNANILDGEYLNIGAEFMLVNNVSGTTITVTRGQLGSTAVLHNTPATVTIYVVSSPFNIVSGASIATNDYIQVDSEIMLVTAGGGTTGLTVIRGQLGTASASHASGANVTIPQLDWIYLSVSANGNETGAGCTGACLYNFYVGNALTATSVASNGNAATGGTSGIIIDNSALNAGASQIYYSTLGAATCTGDSLGGNTGTHGCAIQDSQSAP